MRKFNKERCDILYSILLDRGDVWTNQEEICGIYGVNGGVFHNSSERRTLSQDIQDINESPDYEKIIVSGSRGIKIATEREAEEFIGKMYSEVTSKLQRIRTIQKKVNSNGQIALNKQTIKAFLEEE